MSVISGFVQKIHGRDIPWWRHAIRWVVFLGVAGVVVGALTFFALYRMIGIPDANADFETETTNVYYSDGKHKIGTFAKQDRESISLDEIPSSMQAAAVAAEDRTFYTNRGIDFKGIIRAARNNAASGEIQGGGSTITQQYVKILYLTQERTIKRKVKEAILSIKIHNQLSKSEILEGYLNTIYFGNGAYGIEVASETYFSKNASKLTVPESAALASIINSPSYYDPYVEGGKDRMVLRYNYIIDGMVKAGTLDAADAAKYRDNLPKFDKKKNSNRFSGPKGFLLDTVQKKMRELEFTDSQIDGGGLRIVTTFDYKKQNAAVAAVKAVKPDGLKELHTGVASVQPGTGAVRAMYGGPDYLESQLNWATLGVQPGSTFKAFAVVAALEDGYSLKTQLNGSSPLRIGNAEIENQGDSGGQSFGRVSLERATQKSINTAFVDLVDQMGDGDVAEGATKVLDAAKEAGIPESTIAKIDPVLATPLGYAPVAAIDMANAYATIAAGGKKADWYIIESVEDDQKTNIHKHEKKVEQTISEDVAADTIAAMRGVINGGTGTSGSTICPTAGKTGTATAGEGASSRVSSSWFAGFTPKLATAVMYNRGTGNEQLEGYMLPFYGGTYPAQTFRAYMNGALKGTECGTFPRAANIKSNKGTVVKPPPPSCNSNQTLNDSKTRCIDKPEPDPEPTTEPTPTTPTTPVDKCPDTPNPNDSPPCDDPGGADTDGGSVFGWVFVPLLGLGLRRRREVEFTDEADAA